MKKTLPPIQITENNTAIGPQGNVNGTCCGTGKCGCGPKNESTFSLRAFLKKLFS